MECWVYVDGFNLYNGALERWHAKWLDLRQLSQTLRPHDHIGRIKYFTALVEYRPSDPDQQARQRTYWRALATVGVDIIPGSFRRRPRMMPLVDSVDLIETLDRNGTNVLDTKPAMSRVYRSEEKQSDVSLAAHMIHDAHRSGAGNTFELALLISSDTDFTEAVRIVTQEIGKKVVVCKPDSRAYCAALSAVATATRDLTERTCRACRLPDPVVDAQGNHIAKPSSW
jgi:uncharacterized LabA/DUF88 family protein